MRKVFEIMKMLRKGVETMTLYELLSTLDCHTSIVIINLDEKERIEYDNKYYLDDVEEVLGKWYGVPVHYIRAKGNNQLYVEISVRKVIKL